MFDRKEIGRAVKLQQMSYRLLLWVEGAVEDGFISPESAHEHGTMPDAAYAWIEKHVCNFPEDARPSKQDMRAFSNLFSTYLENSFDLDANPGMRLYSPDAHCFCPMCSWMVKVPHLRPKKPSSGDKKRARMMKRNALVEIAREQDVDLPDDEAYRIVNEPPMRGPLGLCAYACDLLGRLEGRVVGPAALVLWRSFAWTAQGSPKKKFKLTTEAIMEAEQQVVDKLRLDRDLTDRSAGNRSTSSWRRSNRTARLISRWRRRETGHRRRR